MSVIISNLANIWMITGPLLSILVLALFCWKYNHPQTLLRKYKSSDVCILQQLLAHLFGNLVLAIFNIPYIANTASCTVRKWFMIWAHSVVSFCHLTAVLDFGIRTSNLTFYHLFHSKSPYNFLLAIVISTWVPFFTASNIAEEFPQSDDVTTQCDVIEDHSLSHFISSFCRLVLFLFAIGSQIYTVIVVIRRNRTIQDSVAYFNWSFFQN